MLTRELPTSDDSWSLPDEGQLSVDVIETNEAVIIRAAIAGVHAEGLDLYIAEDMVTIRGERQPEMDASIVATYHFRECYWGNFSRTIILPAHIRPEASDAVMKNGVLTITLPKAVVEKKVTIRFED